MKKFLIYILLSFVTLSSFAQIDGGMPGGMPPGGMNGGPGMGPGGKGGPDGKGPGKMTPPKKEKKPKKAKADEVIDGKVPGHVYVYGASFEFGDSIIYFTQIENVDSIRLTKKTKFLPYCSDFSEQLRDKLQSSAFGAKNQTSSVFYAEKKKKLEKVMTKMKKRYLKKGEMRIVQLTEEQFKFVHPLDYYPTPTE